MTDAREALVALIPPPRVPEHVDHWPQDERDYYRHGDFSDWAERLEVLDRMRREKVADAILAAGWTPPTVKPSVEDVARAWNITEADVESLREAAVQGAAWRLLDLTCDLADREPSSEAVEDAMRDARAVLALFEKGEGRG